MPVRTRETNGYGSRLISVVSSAQDTKTDHYELEKIIKWIRTGEGRFSSVINEVRVAVAAGDKDRASDLKRRLPGVLFCGTFNKRRSSELIEASGMICMDFDGVKNAESIIDRLRDDLYIIAAFVSPSGNGLKVILAIPQDPENHLRAFQAAKAYMHDMYGIEADDSGKESERHKRTGPGGWTGEVGPGLLVFKLWGVRRRLGLDSLGVKRACRHGESENSDSNRY